VYLPIPRLDTNPGKQLTYTPIKAYSSPSNSISIPLPECNSSPSYSSPSLRTRCAGIRAMSSFEGVTSTTEVRCTPSSLLDPELKSSVFGMCYSMSSAAIGVQAHLTGKSLSVMARNTTLGAIDIFDPFNFFFVMIISLIFMSTSAFWIWRLSVSLKLFQAMFIIPINQTMWILFSVLSGGLVYNEFANLKVVEILWLISGLIVVLVGIILLVPVNKGDAETIIENYQGKASPLRKCCRRELNVMWHGSSRLVLRPIDI